MFRRTGKIDKTLAFLIVTLVLAGTLIFASAAFGLLARGALNISSVAFNHLVLGVGLGLVMLVACATIDYKIWRKYAPYIFVGGLVLTAAVFIPHLGMEHGGGRRWLNSAISDHPAIGIFENIIYRNGRGLFFFATQRDYELAAQPRRIFGTSCGSCHYSHTAAGHRDARRNNDRTLRRLFRGRRAHATYCRLYLRGHYCHRHHRRREAICARPHHDLPRSSQGQQAESYQLKQSLIAIGSGGVFGRGFGQGVQKFTYLPEPMGDSIFAVAAEELGFIGAVILILLFLAFALRAYGIAARVPDTFGALLAVGLATYLGVEAFINIAAMLGVAPLTGIPLTFISQGGSAMLASLISAGILLNISRYRTKRT